MAFTSIKITLNPTLYSFFGPRPKPTLNGLVLTESRFVATPLSFNLGFSNFTMVVMRIYYLCSLKRSTQFHCYTEHFALKCNAENATVARGLNLLLIPRTSLRNRLLLATADKPMRIGVNSIEE